MADYIVTGKKGDGKSLVCVGKIRDALLAGRAVATNLDLKLEFLLPAGTRNVRCYRLPDYPTLEDMEAIGKGADLLDEDEYGLIVLDEMAVWMNSREFGDKRRMPLLTWFVHSRKKRWHCMFICQGLGQLDKQFRESLADHQVSCRRLDKLRIPYFGPLTKWILGKELRPPKVHHAVVRYGLGLQALKSDTWTYQGHGLYRGYDTEQVFTDGATDGIFSYLSPWHVKGRYEQSSLSWIERIRSFFVPSLVKLPPKPMLPVVRLVSQLPADERIRHVQRLQHLGAVK